MATYPTNIYAPRTKENRSAVVYNPADTKRIYAEDISKLDAEVVALETLIGTSPLGVFASIKDFLASLYALGIYFIGSNTFSAPADSTTYYFGKPGWAGGITQAFYNFRVRSPRAKISSVRIGIGRSGTAPSNELGSLYLRVNTTDHLISDAVDFSAASLQWKSFGFSDVEVVDGDDVCIKMVTPAWTTNPGTLVMQTEIFMQALPA